MARSGDFRPRHSALADTGDNPVAAQLAIKQTSRAWVKTDSYRNPNGLNWRTRWN